MKGKHYIVRPGFRLVGVLVQLGKKSEDRGTLFELSKSIVIKPCFADIADNIKIEI